MSAGRAGRVLKKLRTVHNRITDLISIVGTIGRPHTIQRTVGTQTLQIGIRAVEMVVIIAIIIARISRGKITMEITKIIEMEISGVITEVGTTTNKTGITITIPTGSITQMVIITEMVTTKARAEAVIIITMAGKIIIAGITTIG